MDTVLKSRQFIRWFSDRQNSPETTTKEYLNGKDTNPQRLINNSRILYVNKKRASDWLSLNRLQLPLAYSSIGSDNIISRSDTDVKQKTSEDSGSKYSIKVDMTEEERYNELKDKNLVVVDYNEDKLNSELEKKGISIDFEELKMLKEKQAKKSIKEIAKALGIHNVNYNNSNINFDFVFLSNSLDSSVHHQGDFKGTYADYAKMLSCLDGIIKNAELVEIHPNYKGNKLLKQVYVLVSAFNDGNVIIPVQLEVKEQYDKNNGLYLNVVLGQIKKEPAVKKEIGVAKAYKDLPLVTGSTISLSQLFANVNTGDNKFLKYIPDKFLSEEQVAAKRTAQEADYTKYGRYKEVFDGKPEQKFSLSDPLEETEYDRAITVTDVSTLRSIGRKSVSEFTSEDIEKSKKWAHKFYKELGTKSPFFRAWFGDWRVYDTAEYEPVDIRLNTVYKAGKEVNNDTGKVISWGNTLLSETKNHAKRSNVAPGMLGNISDIIKNAVLLDTTISIPTSNKKMANTAFMHTFYSAATVDGNIWIMRLFAEEALPNKGGDSFTRAYELKEIEKIGEIAEGVHLDKESLTQAKPPISLHNISDLYGFVKQYDPNFNPVAVSPALLNSDGTPKVVYHGTNADFTVFDLSKSGQTAPGISDGFFFFTDKKSNYPNSASDYANSTSRKGGTPKVYGVYLSIKNPLYIDSKGYYDNIAYFDTHSDEIYSTYFSGDYDGVIISNSDKSADDSTLYLLDNASAIKSATDNIGTFDGSNPDIRYSLEDTSEIDYPALLKENTDLKKQNEALAAEMKLTEGHKVSRGAVEKLAGKILREYKSGYDKTVLADNLEKVFNYIADENADAAPILL